MPRNIHLTSVMLACLLGSVCQTALAKNFKLKAGLWQIESRTRLYGHDVPSVKNIIALGPKALNDHVQNMLQQNRMRIDENGTATICVTREQIAKNDFVNDENSGCTVGEGVHIGNTIHYDITCAAPQGSGHTEVNIISRTRWVSTSNLLLTVRGIQQDVGNESIGTWLGATCPQGQ